MALFRPIVDSNGVLTELVDGNCIRPNLLGSGTPTSSTVLLGDGSWTDIGNINYWTQIAGNHIYYSAGRVIVGTTSSSGNYNLEVSGNSKFAGDMQLSGSLTGVDIQLIRQTNFGYSSAYKAVRIGTGHTISLGVDVSAIAGGNFNGSNEIIIPNTFRFSQLDSAGTNFLNNAFSFTNGDFGIDLNKKLILRNSDVTASYLTYTTDFTERTRLISGYGVYIGSTGLDGITLKVGGNVGINTTSPIFKLDVNGSARFANFYTGSATNTLNVGYLVDSDTQDGWINYVGYNGGNTRFRNFHIGNGKQVALVSVVGSTGNVGIGTTSPSTRLQIVDVTPILRLTSTSNFYYTDYTVGGIDSRTNSNGSAPFSIKTGGFDRLYINASGRVLIGTSSDNGSSTLQVGGTIAQSNVISQLVYADGNGKLRAATNTEVATLLGTSASGNYIQNGTALQTANFNISGYGIIDNIKIHKGGVASSMYLGNGNAGLNATGSNNVVLGNGAYYHSTVANNSGINNIAIGVTTLATNTSGSYNIGLGVNSLNSNKIGSINVAIGNSTMLNAITASRNIVIGYYAGRYLGNSASATEIHGYNVAIGWSALQGSSADTTLNIGTHNVALGYNSLLYTENGNYNVGLGTNTLTANKAGIGSIAIGYGAAYTNINKYYITAIGYNAAYYMNGDGSSGSGYNVAVGAFALRGVTNAQATNTGIINTALGANSLYSISTGSGNLSAGYHSGYNLSSGNYNTFIGYNSGRDITTGGYNVVIGSNVATRIATLSNWMIFSDGSGYERFSVSDTGVVLINRADVPYVSNAVARLQVNGGILQKNIISKMVYANADGTLVEATAANIAATLGTENYIVNGTSLQTASFNISSTARIGGTIFADSVGANIRLKDDGTTDKDGFVGASGGSIYWSNFAATKGLRLWNSGSITTLANVTGIGIGTGASSTVYEQLEVASSTNGGRVIFTDGGGVNRYGLLFVSPTASRLYARILGYKYGTGAGGINLILNDSGGNVGIGSITSPEARLQIDVTNVANTNLLKFSTNGGVNNYGDISVQSSELRYRSPFAIGFAPNNTVLAFLTTTGRFLVGTSSEIGGNTHKLQVDSGSTTGEGIYVRGNIKATGNIIADGYFSGTSSDKFYKSNFKQIKVIDVIDNIQVQSYNHALYGGSRLIGSIAQDIEKYFPELITKDGNNRLRVDNYGYTALALQLGKEVKSEVDILKDRVKQLEQQIEQLSR